MVFCVFQWLQDLLFFNKTEVISLSSLFSFVHSFLVLISICMYIHTHTNGERGEREREREREWGEREGERMGREEGERMGREEGEGEIRL